MDDFPTLEVVAGIGLSLLAWRTFQSIVQRINIPRVTEQLVKLLDSDDPDRALKLARAAESPFLTMASRAIAAGQACAPDDDEQETREQVLGAFNDALEDHVQRVGTRRARDMVVLVLLGGAVLYALSADRAPSIVFYVLCGAGAVLLARSIVIQRGMLDEILAVRAPLTDAVVRAARSQPGAPRPRRSRSPRRPTGSELAPCAACGGSELIVVRDPKTAGIDLGSLGSTKRVIVCRECGHATFRVASPGDVPIGEAHGTSLKDADD